MDPGTLKAFCTICINFSTDMNNQYIIGANLGNSPGRRLKKHFSSQTHKRAVERKEALQLKNARKNPIMDMFSSAKEKRRLLMRKAFKNLFITVHMMAKKNMANDVYGDMVKKLARMGTPGIEELIRDAPKNATYCTSRKLKYINYFCNLVRRNLLVNKLQTKNPFCQVS